MPWLPVRLGRRNTITTRDLYDELRITRQHSAGLNSQVNSLTVQVGQLTSAVERLMSQHAGAAELVVRSLTKENAS